MTRKEHFTLRLAPETIERLVKLARHRGLTKTALAERCLEEGIRMAEHPGIVFREGAAGRWPALAGHRLGVRHVIETYKLEGHDPGATAEYFGIALHEVAAAVSYYADYKDEVDRAILEHAEFAEAAEAAWRQGREMLTV